MVNHPAVKKFEKLLIPYLTCWKFKVTLAVFAIIYQRNVDNVIQVQGLIRNSSKGTLVYILRPLSFFFFFFFVEC